ncbi:MAG: DUF2877 domain-containing protein [Desulfobacterota bacterium]|jgi:hypothetical protein|nr:DUF2877 domain-containing protein [Thermodesulfobacteriota bacterium]
MEQTILDKRAGERLVPALVGAGVLSLSGWGEVVSLFTGAVNIRHAQGLLLSLVQDPRDMTSLSVCVPALFQNQERPLALGVRVRLEGYRLTAGDFVLDLLKRPLWQGTLRARDVKGLEASKVTLLKGAVLSQGKDGGLLGLLREEGEDNPFVAKARQVLAGGLPLCGLVGLGPGSTPSGDDFVTGVLLGEEAKAVAENMKPVLAWPEERKGLLSALDRTCDAGKTLLWQALQGRFPAYLIETVRAVSKAEGRAGIDEAVERAVRHGATSGTDALVGFVFSREGAFDLP